MPITYSIVAPIYNEINNISELYRRVKEVMDSTGVPWELILVAGKTSFGSQRWLEVGLVNIQPAEIAKIVLILVLADYFAKQYNKQKTNISRI